jgi:hypothetical protein
MNRLSFNPKEVDPYKNMELYYGSFVLLRKEREMWMQSQGYQQHDSATSASVPNTLH